MKTMTVTLTDEEPDRVEPTARDQGISPDTVLHDAVSNYQREFQPLSDERPDLSFIGVGSSRGHGPTTSAPPETKTIDEMYDTELGAPKVQNHLWFIPESQDTSATSDVASRFDEVLAESITRFLLEEEVSYSPERQPDTTSDLSERSDDDREKGA